MEIACCRMIHDAPWGLLLALEHSYRHACVWGRVLVSAGLRSSVAHLPGPCGYRVQRKLCVSRCKLAVAAFFFVFMS